MTNFINLQKFALFLKCKSRPIISSVSSLGKPKVAETQWPLQLKKLNKRHRQILSILVSCTKLSFKKWLLKAAWDRCHQHGGHFAGICWWRRSFQLWELTGFIAINWFCNTFWPLRPKPNSGFHIGRTWRDFLSAVIFQSCKFDTRKRYCFSTEIHCSYK